MKKKSFTPTVDWVTQKVKEGYAYHKISEKCLLDLGHKFSRLRVIQFIEEHNINYIPKQSPVYTVSIDWMKEELKTKTIGRIAKEQKRNWDIIKGFIERHNLESFVLKKGQGRGSENANAWDGHPIISGTYWGRITTSAKKRNIKFDITPHQAYEIFEKQNGKCALSGEPIFFGIQLCDQKKGGERQIQTASLDRIISKKKIYNLENCQWVHAVIQQMKNKESEEELLRLVKAIYLHNNG
jgi:hypothetical protein